MNVFEIKSIQTIRYEEQKEKNNKEKWIEPQRYEG